MSSLVGVQDGGKVASTKVRLSGGDCFEVSSLGGLVQLNAIRRFLAEGFQCHLAANPLLHQVCWCTQSVATLLC